MLAAGPTHAARSPNFDVRHLAYFRPENGAVVEVSIVTSSHRLGSTVGLVLAGLTLTVGNLQAQEVGNPDQGLRIARGVCAECHLVDKVPGEQSPNLIAPTFEHIANTSGMNSTALTAALRTSHESMPNIIIKGSDLDDVIAYILSLQKNR
jgi:mono/diheme cytochrome c family protein